MWSAAARALSQLADPGTFRILVGSALAAAGIFAALWFGIVEVLAHEHLFETRWLDWAARILLGLGAVVLTFYLYSAVAVLVASFFLEAVARAVERRWYPGIPAPRPQPLRETVALALSLTGANLLWNLLALPLYLIPGANIVVFLLVNGYLLGREYFELAAQRRVDRKAIVVLRRYYRFRLLIGGMLIAALSFVPLANFVTPILATAFMLHLFHALPESRQGLQVQAVR
ncbi:MAG TPA: EI24 domain-containing protein [Alphaproteobacteria bacterium]|nr:EI24 domain-containing protein [Alphaproteobacteria bacterium]